MPRQQAKDPRITVDVSIANDGGGQSHENMPPFYVLTYIIKKERS